MENNNINIEKEIKIRKKKINSFLWKHFNYLINKIIPKRFINYFIWFLVLLIITFKFWWPSINKLLIKPEVIGVSTDSTNDNKSVMLVSDEFERNLIINQCNGSQFDILSGKYFEQVGGERFNAENLGYSARNTKEFQASSRTRWGCNIPFITTIVSYPVSGKSFGLFIEYENMFKVLIGDGDRKTIRVEVNKFGYRGLWPELKDSTGKKRPSLINPVEIGEEVITTIKVKELNSKIVLNIEVLHSKFQSVEKFDFEFEPTGINYKADQERNFRIGINDSRYKGEGSVIDLKTFSIKEGEW